MSDEYITEQEAMKLLGFSRTSEEFRKKIYKQQGVLAIWGKDKRAVFDKFTIEQLCLELPQACEIPDGYVRINQLVKEFPQLTARRPIMKGIELLRKVPALKALGKEMRRFNSFRTFIYYPQVEARKEIERTMERYNHDGFLKKELVMKLMTPFLKPYKKSTFAYHLKKKAQEMGIELNYHKGYSLYSDCVTCYYSKACIEELICECIENV